MRGNVSRAARHPDVADDRAMMRPCSNSETVGNGKGRHIARGVSALSSRRGALAVSTPATFMRAATTGVEAFMGPFLHYARWRPEEALGCLEQSHRMSETHDLYAHVFSLLGPCGVVVEVGCGLGVRCRAMASCCPPLATNLRAIIGVDASADVVARATGDSTVLCERRDPRVRFVAGGPDRLPFGDTSVDRILSVGALHGRTVSAAADFIAEAARCLVPGGRLVLCAFLGRHVLTAHQRADMASRLGTDVTGVEQIGDVDQLCRTVRAAGLNVVADTLRPVGDQVWRVFCAWCMLAHPLSAWPAAWYYAYAPGWIDYFIIAADKPR
ncbi:Methyltransferase type 11 [Pandoravirus kuranda]|uniref:Methyltransferase type 11 n=1 Tax=Pandoravirus kuranda TaxID=3019033 RepID=A0AA95EEX2_9VIRU|nr:Methyltransferase type 11 [Pandoravirus kuranda]